MRLLLLLFSFLLLGALAWPLLPAVPAAITPALHAALPAQPVFLQQASGRTVANLPPSAGPAPLLGLPNSTIPPGPPPGGTCSVSDPAVGNCSAFQANQRCTALNDQGNFCSTLNLQGVAASETCSAFARNAACSVLPTSSPPGNPSVCSTIPQLPNAPIHRCSAVGQAMRQLCSTKGVGASSCSVYNGGSAPVQCSVLNPGARQRSFCSAKFNQPTLAKGCSTHFNFNSECSVISGGKGVCTTFGAADPGSCSALGGAPSHCSVIGGPAGNPCVQ